MGARKRPPCSLPTAGSPCIRPHHSTREILASRGFYVVSSAEFLGKHTFNLGGWAAMTGRPNDDDYTVARLFAEKTYERFIGKDSGLARRPRKNRAIPRRTLDNFELFRFSVVTQLPTGAERNAACACSADKHARRGRWTWKKVRRIGSGVSYVLDVSPCARKNVLHVNDLSSLLADETAGGR